MPSRTLRAARASWRRLAYSLPGEFQRDWSRKEHYEEVMAVVKEHCGAYGQGIEYAATMVQKEPASRNRRSSNT
jgi:hypothetical protein